MHSVLRRCRFVADLTSEYVIRATVEIIRDQHVCKIVLWVGVSVIGNQQKTWLIAIKNDGSLSWVLTLESVVERVSTGLSMSQFGESASGGNWDHLYRLSDPWSRIIARS